MDKWLIKVKPTSGDQEQSTSTTLSYKEVEVNVISASNGEENYIDDSGEREQNTDIFDCSPIKKKRKLWRPSLNPCNLIKEFPWLDESLNYPFCKICHTKLSGGKFHLKRHEKQPVHVKRIQAASTTPLVDIYFEKQGMTSHLVKKAELKLAAFTCIHNLPFMLLDHLPLLERNIYPDSEICKNLKIKRKKATQLVVQILAPYFQKELIEDLKAMAFSVIIDEMTDISIEKSLIIIVRYWKNGSVKDRILDVIKVENSTSEAIFTSIKTLFDVHKIPYANIIAFASDGASTMMGKISGVQARFKEIAPHIYVQVCLCHALHLCSSAATKKLPDVVEQFVRDIYSYFSHSSKRQSELQECQIFAEEKPHKMLYASQTRWLSLRAVTERVLEHWSSLTLFFQCAALEDNLPNAKAILNALRNPVYKLYFLFLSYILELIVKINLELQSASSKFPILLERMSSLYKVILKNYIKPEVINRDPFIHVTQLNQPNNYIDLNDIYSGAKTEAFLIAECEKRSLRKEEIENFQRHVLAFYIELTQQITSRFNFKDKYLLFAANFAPGVVKSQSVRSIANFINLFPQVECDIEEVNVEWQLLSEQNLSNFSNDVGEFWSSVFKMKNSLNEQMFPKLTSVVKIILILPHSSAAAERGFSQLSLNKNKFRNRLQVKTCAGILIVKDYIKNCTNGIDTWNPPLACLNFTESTFASAESSEFE